MQKVFLFFVVFATIFYCEVAAGNLKSIRDFNVSPVGVHGPTPRGTSLIFQLPANNKLYSEHYFYNYHFKI